MVGIECYYDERLISVMVFVAIEFRNYDTKMMRARGFIWRSKLGLRCGKPA